jgi:hypothetical protein
MASLRVRLERGRHSAKVDGHSLSRCPGHDDIDDVIDVDSPVASRRGQDTPGLSVDIDVIFVDHRPDREAAHKDTLLVGP